MTALDTTGFDVAPNIIQHRLAGLPSVLFLETASFNRGVKINNVCLCWSEPTDFQ